jgi:hypothetical protein
MGYLKAALIRMASIEITFPNCKPIFEIDFYDTQTTIYVWLFLPSHCPPKRCSFWHQKCGRLGQEWPFQWKAYWITPEG